MRADTPAVELRPEDLLAAAAASRDALAPSLQADWAVRAGDLDWSCHRTLDHIADALVIYSAHLASRARERLPRVRNGNPTLSPAELLRVVEVTAAILAEVVRAAPPGTRAFHPAGLADASGFVAMGCTEILIHTADIAQGLAQPFTPPADLPFRVLRRLFPWAPSDGVAWAVLRWVSGRGTLPGRDRLAPDWYWHCAPLEEWDGTVKKRLAPAAWS